MTPLSLSNTSEVLGFPTVLPLMIVMEMKYGKGKDSNDFVK